MARRDKPNVIFIYADDLGRGILGCYGQKIVKTPNIDRLAREGMQFTNAHGCNICAPARASLICGVHDCHAGGWTFTRAGVYKDIVRGKLTLEKAYELIHNTGVEQRAGDRFLPMVFRDAGYVTGQIGKLEWGFSTTGEEIARHGWDYHYGYYDHEMCHGYYPPFLFENGEMVRIPGNTDPDCGSMQYRGFQKDGEDEANGRCVYSQDLFDEKLLQFIQEHRDEPFFLHHPTQLPHGQLSIPQVHPSVADDSRLTYAEKLYASMVMRMDETVGKVLDTLEELGLAEDTLVLFGADNGHVNYYSVQRNGFPCHMTAAGVPFDHLTVRYTSETCGDVLDGNNGRTGCKASNFEGGCEVPLIARWPGRVRAGAKCGQLVANYDFMATMAELLGTDQGERKDGVSYLGALLETPAASHEHIVFASENGPAIVTREGWKLRSYLKDYRFGIFGAYWEEIPGRVVFELYKVSEDYREENDLAAQYPQVTRALMARLVRECDGNLANGTPQAHFAFYGYDYLNEMRGR